MIKLIGERGSGKTGKLIELAAEQGGTIVCKNPNHIVEKGYSMGITSLNVVSYVQYLASKDAVNGPVFVDDMDALLEAIDPRIAGFTAARED